MVHGAFEPERFIVGVEPVPADVPVAPEEYTAPATEVEPDVGLLPVEATGAAEVICAYPWDCPTALRVARCESGSDLEAGFNVSGHAGTFQISPIHAWRFAKRGLDFWTDATTLTWNVDVAYELWTERGWYAWSCF